MHLCRGIIGCGAMGRAIAHYWVKNFPHDKLVIADRCEINLNALATELRDPLRPTTLQCKAVDAFDMHNIAIAVQSMHLVLSNEV